MAIIILEWACKPMDEILPASTVQNICYEFAQQQSCTQVVIWGRPHPSTFNPATEQYDEDKIHITAQLKHDTGFWETCHIYLAGEPLTIERGVWATEHGSSTLYETERPIKHLWKRVVLDTTTDVQTVELEQEAFKKRNSSSSLLSFGSESYKSRASSFGSLLRPTSSDLSSTSIPLSPVSSNSSRPSTHSHSRSAASTNWRTRSSGSISVQPPPPPPPKPTTKRMDSVLSAFKAFVNNGPPTPSPLVPSLRQTSVAQTEFSTPAGQADNRKVKSLFTAAGASGKTGQFIFNPIAPSWPG